MSEQQAAEAQVQAPIGAVEGRPGVVVVTQENFNDYVRQELGPSQNVIPDSETENADPEAVAAAEFAALEEEQAEQKAAAEAPKEGDQRGSEVFFKGKWTPKHNFNYRLHLKTQEAEAAAQAKIDAAAAEAKAAKEAAEAAARERDELKAKYEPAPPAEIGPEPDEANYTDMAKFKADLKAWSAENARREDAAKRAEQQAKQKQEAALKAWNERVTETKAAIPDYETTVTTSPVKVSDEIRDAIIESDVGPQVLYHFAQHPEVADAMGKMSVRQMLVAFGKLEASLGNAEKPQTKATAPIPEISKAPAPINPLRGGNAGTNVKVDAAGNWTGSYEDYKAARAAGKIK